MSLPVPLRQAVRRMPPFFPPAEGRRGFLRLDANENTAGASKEVMRAIVSLSAEDISAYPEYRGAERRIARFFGVRPDELIVTSGIDDALRLVADAFAEAGEKVLLVEPTFPMYRFYAQLLGAKAVTLRYDEKFRFPLEGVLRVLRRDRPRLFFLANPNNPTGELLPAAQIRNILGAARHTMVVVDEAYYDFSGETVADSIGRSPNLVITRTFSKAAALAGLRLGCVLAGCEVTAALRTVRPPFPVNSAALAAALAAIGPAGRGSTRLYVREVVAARADLVRALSRLGVPVLPSAANFVLADFGPRATALVEHVRQRGILLRDQRIALRRAGWVRITIGTRSQTHTLIAEMKEFLSPKR